MARSDWIPNGGRSPVSAVEVAVLAGQWQHCWLASVHGKRVPPVVHDRHAVVCCVVDLAVRTPLVLRWVHDVVEVNRDVLIPVRPVLSVMVAQAVEKLMGDVATILPVPWLQGSPSD